MIFTSKRRARAGLQPSVLFARADAVAPPDTAAPTDAVAPTDAAESVHHALGPVEVATSVGGESKDADQVAVTARWLVLTTDVTRGFARALLPEPFALADRPQLAVWIVEPLSADSTEVGVPVGRLFAGMSCNCLLPGEQDESAYTSDFLVGAPIADGDRDPFALPDLPQTALSLVNGVGGMGFSIPPVDGGGRGVVGRVELSDSGSGEVQLTPDWMACQSWRPDLVGASGDAPGGPDLVHTQWDVTRLSPIVTGSAVVECAEFGPHSYDLSGSAAALDARYGFARVAILGRQ
ncbi:hypothetical protein C8K36_101195 [Rhodococcus sp. OK519]|uniref:hypothetical protein n=1 Tax=Rhodococcus sp. OK519 TaxID=2135729 RepID=UPI000D338AB6|nr:hypothetical protein C8K36_101195 [Rhodococcus sp. OK519]